jgi:eukaryotic-like serine/threonine-protein kinase
MTVANGTRLGPYEITGKLGEGGMGEVYRATDSRLKREVAIKVLPPAFTADRERLARFEREAQLLAQLNHPNIAAVFGLEETGGVFTGETGGGSLALVMELVEGPTLAERLSQGPLPLDECLPIALQIAQALEEAHEKGIVHRDLKPGNVKLRPDSTVKVLDFGLAKALDPVGVASSAPALGNLANSPTLTRAGTELGMVLGTAAYMAPEQAKGFAVDRRADVWAFGVVLYEMFTGAALFAGDSASDTLAAVLRAGIDLERLPAETPPEVRRLLRRCLERNPKNRLRDIGDARLVLAEAITSPEVVVAAAPVAAPRARQRWARAVPWALAIVAAAAATWALARPPGGAVARSAGDEVTQVELSLPPGVDLVTRVPAGLAVSPDGRTIAMTGFREGQRRLYVRRLDSPEATEIRASSGVNALTFSPDGQSIAFVPGGSRVVRFSLADQQSTVLATCADLRNSVAWGESSIYYLCAGEIWRVPAAGGDPVQLTRLEPARHEVLHTDPVEVPGGRHLLFANLTDDAETSRIESLSLADGARAVVVEHASTPVVSSTGHLLFEREGALWAIKLDPLRAAASGRPTEVLPATAFAPPMYGTLAYRLSPTGTLVFMPRDFDEKRMVTVARDGSERALELPAGAYGLPRVSGDGRRLLFETSQTLEALDLERGTRTQIAGRTFGTSFAIWSSDSRRIVFRRQTVPVWVAADGSGRGGAVPGATINDYPASPAPDPDAIFTVLGRAGWARSIARATRGSIATSRSRSCPSCSPRIPTA